MGPGYIFRAPFLFLFNRMVSGVRCQQTDDRLRNLVILKVIRLVILTPDTYLLLTPQH